MTNLIKRLQKIDHRRAMLLTYSRRIKLARPFAREAEQRMQSNIDTQFRSLTRERNQVLELIKADPVMRKELFDLEEAVRKKDAVAKAKAEALKEQKRASIRAAVKSLTTKFTPRKPHPDRERER